MARWISPFIVCYPSLMTKMHVLVTAAVCLAMGAWAEASAHAQAGAPAPTPAPTSPAAPTATPDAPLEDPAEPTDSSQPAPEPESMPAPEPAAEIPLQARPEAQFIGLNRQDGISRYAAELSYTNFDSEVFDGGDGATIIPLRIGLFGQYLGQKGYGGYGGMNFSIVKGEDDTSSAISNIEVGGIYLTKLGTTELVTSAALVLGTASDDDIGDFLTNAFNSFSRVNDLILFTPNITWLRVAGSPVIRNGNLLFRGDIGADVPLTSQGDYQFTPVLHLNFGVGYVQDRHQISFELVNLLIVNSNGDGDEGDSTENAHSIGLTYRNNMGQFSPYAGLSKVFGSQDLDDFRFTLTAGVGGVFGP